MAHPTTQIAPPTGAATLNWWRTVRFAVRHGWDALGLLCAVSLTVFGMGLIPVAVFYSVARFPLAGVALGGASAALILGPLVAGTSVIAFRLATFEEATYADLWTSAARLFKRAVSLAALELLGWALILSNLLFYLSRPGALYLAASVAILYLAAFWALNCLLHWPMLAAMDAGCLPRADGAIHTLRTIVRNGALVSIGAPLFGLALLASSVALAAVFTVSGVGLALLGAGSIAMLASQSATDLLVRFGAMAPLPDIEAPVTDEVWRLRG